MSNRSTLTRRTLLLALLAAMASPSFAQKGGKPNPPAEPAASGTIYYIRSANGYQTVFAMKADGSNKQVVFTHSQTLLGPFPSGGYFGTSPFPSACVHGSDPIHDRWFIVPRITGHYDEYITDSGTSYNVPHIDLFAIRTRPSDRSQLESVQLTDLYGVVNFSQFPYYWSNNSNTGPDSFIAANGSDLRGRTSLEEDAEGNIAVRVDLRGMTHQQRNKTLRLPIASTDVQQGWLNSNFPTLGRDADPEELDFLIEMMSWPYLSLLTNAGELSPNGDGLLQYRGGADAGIRIIDTATNEIVRTVWEDPDSPRGLVDKAQWSPDGDTFAIHTGHDGDILTLPASGTTDPQVLLRSGTTSTTKGKTTTTTTTRYEPPRWSHDSRFLVLRYVQDINGTSQKGLLRVTRDGSVLNLGLDSSTYSYLPIRWVSDNPAP